MPVADGVIRVPPDSTGKYIRTVEVNAILPDGTVGVVEMQVLVLVDAAGRPVDQRESVLLLTEIRDLLRDIRDHQVLHEGI